MKSGLDVRLGCQKPTILHSPPGVVSLAAAEEAIELADAYGVCDGNPLSDSQRTTLRNALGVRADGLWAATRVGNFGPRQGTGKNDAIAARELAGLILFDEQLIIHTAHEFQTANESFLRLVAVFDNYDDLRKRVARIRYANGEQGIELLTGQRLKYRARTGGSGRGFAKADLIVYDEAQHLQSEHKAASAPTKMANPNSQTWYAGSGGLATSAAAWAIRRAALLGNGGRLAYTEMTGETITIADGAIDCVAPDPTDREVWYRCIPGLGRWVTEEAVETLYDELEDLFAREILCVWAPDPVGGHSVFAPGLWLAVSDPSAAPTNVTFGVDAQPERSSASIVACDEYARLEVIDCAEGVGWLSARVAELAKRHNATVAVDTQSPAHSFADEWERAGVTVKRLASREMVGACGTFYDAVVNGQVKVRPSAVLDRAVAGARKRYSGDVWYWMRKDTNTDVSPLIAASIARWVAVGVDGPSVYEARAMRVL